MTPASPPFAPNPFRAPVRPLRPAVPTWWLGVPPGTDPKYRIN